MKYLITCLVIVFLSSCHTVQKHNGEIVGESDHSNKKYQVVKTPILIDSDTTFESELRFYKIKSSMDCTKMMYENYGEWGSKYAGKYQSNINQFVWKKIKLLDTEETFNIITDGTETQENYFSSIIIYDSSNQNCLGSQYVRRDEILNVLITKMENISSDTKVYKLFN